MRATLAQPILTPRYRAAPALIHWIGKGQWTATQVSRVLGADQRVIDPAPGSAKTPTD